MLTQLENLRENRNCEEETNTEANAPFWSGSFSSAEALEEKPWQYKVSLQDALCSIVGIDKLQDRIKNEWEEAEQVIPSFDNNWLFYMGL